MSRLLVATITLIITRDAMTILPTTVPVHEKPIAEAVFGADNVQESEDQSAAVPVEIDAEGEVTRLENKYGPAALEQTHGKAYVAAINKAAADAAVPEQPADAKKTKAAKDLV